MHDGDTLCPVMDRLWRWCGLAACARPEPAMTLPRSAADVLSEHVAFEVECIDRMYLNVYVPQLQPAWAAWCGTCSGQLGQRFASTATVGPKTVAFVASPSRSLSPGKACGSGELWRSTSARTTSPSSICSGSTPTKGFCTSAAPRRRRPRGAHRAASLCTHRHELSVGGRWKRDGEPLLLSTAWTTTSARSS